MPSLVKDFKTYAQVRRESKQRQQDSQRSLRGSPDKSNMLVTAPILSNASKSSFKKGLEFYNSIDMCNTVAANCCNLAGLGIKNAEPYFNTPKMWPISCRKEQDLERKQKFKSCH